MSNALKVVYNKHGNTLGNELCMNKKSDEVEVMERLQVHGFRLWHSSVSYASFDCLPG